MNIFHETVNRIATDNRNKTRVANIGDTVTAIKCPANFHWWESGTKAEVIDVRENREDLVIEYVCTAEDGLTQILVGSDISEVEQCRK